MSEEREARLPKWAQDELNHLRNRAAEARQQLAEAIGTNPSPIEIEPYGAERYKRPRIFVPADHSIEITLPGGRINLKIEDSFLQVIGYGEGDYSLAAFPNSGNVLLLGFAKGAE